MNNTAQKAEHTPGPWEAIKLTEGRFAVGAAYRDENGMPMEGFIADVPLEANARLIAAAPDGLTVAKALLHWMDECEQDEPIDAVIALARAFVAKATNR